MSRCPSLILQCEDSVEGILTAIYDAFVEKKKIPDFQNGDIVIAIGGYSEGYLFARQLEIRTDLDKAQKTLQSIQRKISYLAYKRVLSALCHFDADRGNAVLGFLIKGFSMGAKVTEALADPYVMRVMELARKVDHEAHLFTGFVRFHDIGKFLYSQIEPKCHVLPQILEHFEERYPNENYAIYDTKRHIALVHPAFCLSFFVYGDEWHVNLAEHTDHFEELWKAYFTHMEIKERHNPKCQRNLLPKWYRKNMVEFH